MKNNFLKILPLIALLLTACDIERSARNKHEQEAPKAAADNLKVESVDPTESSKVDLKAIYSRVQAIEAAKDAKSVSSDATDVIQKLEPFILSTNFILDPRFASMERSRVMLSYYNTALLALAKSSDQTARLNTYTSVVSYGCDENLRGCKTLGFFKQDHRSAQILVLQADALDKKMEPNKSDEVIQAYYNTLSLTFELKNGVRDRDLEFLYLKRAREYASWYRRLPEEKQNSDLMSRHGRVFELIVNSYPNDINNPKFQEFVSNFGPWNYSRLQKDPFPFGTKRMFTFAASSMLYADKMKNVLSKEFQQSIDESQKIPAAPYEACKGQKTADPSGPSFKEIIFCIKSNPTLPFIFRGLSIDLAKVENPAFYDEYFFIIDRLYRGHWDVQEASEVWRGSNQNNQKLIDTLEAYVKIQTLDMIIRTNQHFSTIVAQPDLNNENLIRQVVERSTPVSDRWKDLLSRLEGRVAIFMGSNLRNSKAADSSLEKSEILIQSLRRNIKYFSVYPNIILLSYFIQEMQAETTVMTFFGPYTIQPSQIIEELFNGRSKVLFDFGNDTYPLNKIQLLYAYYFALTTGSFETFKGSLALPADQVAEKKPATPTPGPVSQAKPTKVTPQQSQTSQQGEKTAAKPAADEKLSTVDRKSFFEKVVRAYLSKDRTRLQNMLQSYTQNRGDNNYKNLLSDCQKIKKNDLNFGIETTLEGFNEHVAYGFPANGTQTGMVKDLFRVYQFDAAMKNMGGAFANSGDIENMSYSADRNLETRIAFIQIMVDILVKNMNDLNFDKKDIEEIQKAAQSEISSIQVLSDSLYKEIISQHKEVNECTHVLIEFDRKTQLALLKKEEEHLAAVHKFYLANKGKSAEDLKKALDAIPGRLGMIDGLDEIYPDYYKYNRINAILRLKDVAAKMTPAINVTVPTNWKESKLYTESQVVKFQDLNGKDVTVNEFVRNGMNYYGFRNIRMLDWVKNFSDMRPIKEKVRAMIEMYRYGLVHKLKKEESINPEDIVNEMFFALELSSIRTDEKDLIDMVGASSKIDLDSLQNFLLREGFDEKGVMDYALETIAKQDIIFDEAKTVYRAYDEKSTFLFTPDQKLSRTILKRYRPLIEGHLEVIENFKNTITQLETKLAAEKVKRTYIIRIYDGKLYGFDFGSNAQKLELVSNQTLRNTRGKVEEFHSDTGNEFNPTVYMKRADEQKETQESQQVQKQK
jgi:hypothetical protein